MGFRVSRRLGCRVGFELGAGADVRVGEGAKRRACIAWRRACCVAGALSNSSAGGGGGGGRFLRVGPSSPTWLDGQTDAACHAHMADRMNKNATDRPHAAAGDAGGRQMRKLVCAGASETATRLHGPRARPPR